MILFANLVHNIHDARHFDSDEIAARWIGRNARPDTDITYTIRLGNGHKWIIEVAHYTGEHLFVGPASAPLRHFPSHRRIY